MISNERIFVKSSQVRKDFHAGFLTNFIAMKSWKNLNVLIGITARFCIFGFLLFAYFVNLGPRGPLCDTKLDSAEKTVVLDEADADLSSDFKIDLVDEMVIIPVYPDIFFGFFSDVTEERVVKSQTDLTVHLEILTPPPRLNS